MSHSQTSLWSQFPINFNKELNGEWPVKSVLGVIYVYHLSTIILCSSQLNYCQISKFEWLSSKRSLCFVFWRRQSYIIVFRNPIKEIKHLWFTRQYSAIYTNVQYKNVIQYIKDNEKLKSQASHAINLYVGAHGNKTNLITQLFIHLKWLNLIKRHIEADTTDYLFEELHDCNMHE